MKGNTFIAITMSPAPKFPGPRLTPVGITSPSGYIDLDFRKKDSFRPGKFSLQKTYIIRRKILPRKLGKQVWKAPTETYQQKDPNSTKWKKRKNSRGLYQANALKANALALI